MKCSVLHFVVIYLFSFGVKVNAQNVIAKENDGLYSFDFGEFYFEVNANRGGRNSSFKIDGRELMYIEDDKYFWGSVLWLSPQSEWDWPPSDELDQKPFDGRIDHNYIILKSEKDAKSGISVVKKLFASKDKKTISHLYTLKNESGTIQKKAAWEVTRVPCGGLSFFPMGDGKVWGPLADLTEEEDGIVYYKFDDSHTGGRKFFADGSEGWLAHVTDDNLLFVKKFKDIPYDKQAPNEGEIELWLTENHTNIELENQSEYVTLTEGDSLNYSVEWYLRKLPKGITVEVGSADLVKFIRQLLESDK